MYGKRQYFMFRFLKVSWQRSLKWKIPTFRTKDADWENFDNVRVKNNHVLTSKMDL